MARKSGRKAQGIDHSGRNSTVDHQSADGQRQNQPRIIRPSKNPTPKIAKSAMRALAAQRGQSDNTSSEEQSDGTAGNADALDTDKEDDDDDGDSDAFAPSGCNNQSSSNQTGRALAKVEKAISSNRTKNNKNSHSTFKRNPSQKLNTVSNMEQSDSEDDDDDAYNALDDISVTHEKESDIEQLEEKDIIESEENNRYSKALKIPTVDIDELFNTLEESDEYNDCTLLDDGHFDMQFAHTDPAILDNDMKLEPLWLHMAPNFTRRVHFRESEEDIPGVPDSTLTPPKSEAFGSTTSAGQENEHEDDTGPVGSSSGYETDYDDETDEAGIDPSIGKDPQELVRQPSPSPMDRGDHFPRVTSSIEPLMNPSAVHLPGTHVNDPLSPPLGFFKKDLTKHSFTSDCAGNIIMIATAKQPLSGSFVHVESPTSMVSPVANASLVMSASRAVDTLNDREMCRSDLTNHVLHDPVLGPGSESMADALLPTGSTNRRQNPGDLSQSSFYHMEGTSSVNSVFRDHDKNIVKVGAVDNSLFAEFFTIPDDKSDAKSDAENRSGLEVSLPTPDSTSPIRISTNDQVEAQSVSDAAAKDPLAHFDRGVIGAFRHNQTQHPQHQPYRHNSGIQLKHHGFTSARLPPHNLPVNAPKKRKLSGTFPLEKSTGPLFKKRLINHR